MTWQLRAARAADCVALAQLWHAAWHDAHAALVPAGLLPHRGLAHFRALADEQYAAIVVVAQAELLLGMCGVDEDEAELETLFVASPARGTGVADALIAHAEQRLAQRWARAHLGVVVGNRRARRFYERHGWHDVGPYAYAATVPGGTIDVPHRRYEKALPHEVRGHWRS